MVTYFRLYDPLEPHRSWAMLDIEQVSDQRGVYAASLFKLQARFSFHSLSIANLLYNLPVSRIGGVARRLHPSRLQNHCG